MNKNSCEVSGLVLTLVGGAISGRKRLRLELQADMAQLDGLQLVNSTFAVHNISLV